MQLYVSQDEGWTFDLELERSYDVADWILKDVDMVVAGDAPANIKVFIGEIHNTGTSGQEDGNITIKRLFDGTWQLMYQKYYGNDHAYSISMACDSRAAGADAIPYCVAAAWTGESTSPKPRVDIDLSRGQAVFAWKDNYFGALSPAKSYVDAEWWVVGTDELNADQEIEVYPNPVNGRFFINIGNKTTFSYSICTMSGQVVIEGNCDQAETEIVLPDMINPGVYLLIVKSGERSFSQKVIIQ